MKKILVVDDEYLISRSLSAAFKDGQTGVMTASDGEAALKAINENSFDLCFLDVYLPDINGLDIMKTLKRRSPGTQIVIMTASEITEEMMKSVQESARLLISKPFDLDRLKALVDRTLTTGSPLCRDERAAPEDPGSFVRWIADDMRRYERKPVSSSIPCFPAPLPGDLTTDSLSTRVVDISEAGMCIRTDCPLQPGRILNVFEAPAECTAIIRWCTRTGSPEAYHAGIQFL
jgi:CheY-like chemotaxis protein